MNASLAITFAALMTAQSALGLGFPGYYRDVEWIRATWFGNDLVTLVVAVPLLLAGRAAASRGSMSGPLIELGVVAYGVYNYAFYLLGAALNVFFPLYVALFMMAVTALIVSVPRLQRHAREGRVRAAMAGRMLGGYFALVGLALACVWVGMWAGYVFFAVPLPVEADVFRLVAALDLSMMVPALIVGGTLLARGNTSGPAIAGIAAVQASLYLLVLAVNAALAVWSGLTAWPGELLVWGPLFVPTTIATAVLLVAVGRDALHLL